MIPVQLTLHVACPPERVEQQLLDETFLQAFVATQHPVEQHVHVDPSTRLSESQWTVDMQGELPAVVARFVGRRARINLVFALAASEVRMRAEANRDGRMTCSLELTGDGSGGTTMTLDGSLSVSGAFGGMAEGMVRDQVVVPVLRDDLGPLLEELC